MKVLRSVISGLPFSLIVKAMIWTGGKGSQDKAKKKKSKK